jgi:hypothetical protein
MAVDLNTFISRFWNSRLPQISSGGGSASGVLTVSTTSAGTPASTTETDLWTYSLPAGTLSADGRAVRITVVMSFGATANTKTPRVYFGSTVVHTFTSANSGGNVKFIVEVTRTGVSAQLGTSNQTAGGTGGTTGGVMVTTPAADTTAAITIKASGQNDVAAAANDTVFKFALVELLN